MELGFSGLVEDAKASGIETPFTKGASLTLPLLLTVLLLGGAIYYLSTRRNNEREGNAI